MLSFTIRVSLSFVLIAINFSSAVFTKQTHQLTVEKVSKTKYFQIPLISSLSFPAILSGVAVNMFALQFVEPRSNPSGSIKYFIIIIYLKIVAKLFVFFSVVCGK